MLNLHVRTHLRQNYSHSHKLEHLSQTALLQRNLSVLLNSLCLLEKTRREDCTAQCRTKKNPGGRRHEKRHQKSAAVMLPFLPLRTPSFGFFSFPCRDTCASFNTRASAASCRSSETALQMTFPQETHCQLSARPLRTPPPAHLRRGAVPRHGGCRPPLPLHSVSRQRWRGGGGFEARPAGGSSSRARVERQGNKEEVAAFFLCGSVTATAAARQNSLLLSSEGLILLHSRRWQQNVLRQNDLVYL